MKKAIVTLLAAYWFAGAHLYSQNLILNGSFEAPSLAQNTTAGTVPTFWTAGGPAPVIPVRIFNGNGGNPSVWPLPEDGQQFADCGNDGQSLSQTFTVTNDGQYQLTWQDSSGHLGGLSKSPYAMVLLEGSSPVVPTNTFDAYHQTFGTWQERSLQLSLSAGQYTIEFVSQGVANGLDSLIDNVSLSQNPELSVISGGVVSGCDGLPIAGASVKIGAYSATTDVTGSYSISNVPPGNYVASVSQSNYFTLENDNGTIASGQSQMTWGFVLYPIADIISQPQAQSVGAGATVTFGVLTECSGHETYQWQFNGIDLADNARVVGSHAAVLSISNVQASDAGGYAVTVKPADFWTVDSSVAQLSVIGPPVVSLTSPTNGASFGTDARLLVTASASENDGTVRNVEFFQNRTNLMGSVAAPPYEFMWSNAPAGSYLLSAVAIDGFGLSSTSSVTITITNSLSPLPPGPPMVTITSPTNGQTFSSGSTIPVTGSAFETNGSIAKVVLIVNTNTVLSTSTASPYSLLWTNAPVGTDYLMAVATDASGITATSTVRVVILPPVQPPRFAGGPDITVAQNGGPQSFTNWATSIYPGTPGGSLSFKVSDDNPGLFSTPPTLSSDGTLSFIPAGNAAGVAHCQVVLDCSDGLSSGPTRLTITVVAPEDVAIILASAEADPGPVTNDVSAVSLPGEQSLSFQLFQRSQLSSPVLSLFKLIVWYDPDGTLPVAPGEVSLLQNLYSNGLPLIFVGPRLVSSGANLPLPAQAVWSELLHLQPDGTPGISGAVNPAGASGSGTLLPSGAYGVITPFDIQTLVDEATVTPDADSDGQLGTNDVLVSFPSANAANADLLVRTFTELLPLGLDTDSSSFRNRNEILQNAICWAVHCGVCPEVFLSFGDVVDPSTPQTGQPATLGFAIGNNGECDGAAYQAVISLDPGLRLISASSDYGKVTTVSNLVMVYVGRIPARQNINLTVTVLPVVPGWVTNQIHLQSASSSAQELVSSFLVQGQRIPELAIQPVGPTAVLLSAWGQPGAAYVLERAPLQPQGGAFIWAPLTNFVYADPVFRMQDAIQPLNSGFLYRIQTTP